MYQGFFIFYIDKWYFLVYNDNGGMWCRKRQRQTGKPKKQTAVCMGISNRDLGAIE